MPGKPSEFFVGVVDLFAILLPGAVLTALLSSVVYETLVGSLFLDQSTTARWLGFAICSYFLGHLLFLVGSALDPVYDAMRLRFCPTQDDKALCAAQEMKKRTLGEFEEASNSYKWSKSVLRIQAPAYIAEIDRVEANSKFFRSLAVLLVVVAVWLFATAECLSGLILLVLSLLSVWRYGDQRFKGTELAYVGVVTLLTLNPKITALNP